MSPDYSYFARLSDLEKRLALCLLDANVVDSKAIALGIIEKEKTKKPLHLALNVSPDEEKNVCKILAGLMSLEFADLEKASLSKEWISIIPFHLMTRLRVVAIGGDEKVIKLAMADPTNKEAITDIKLIMEREVMPVVATKSGIFHVISRVYDLQTGMPARIPSVPDETLTIPDSDESYCKIDFARQDDILKKLSIIAGERPEGGESQFNDDPLENLLGELGENDAPIVRLSKLIFSVMIAKDSSEAIIEADSTKMTIRAKVREDFENIMESPPACYGPLIRRLKLMANWRMDQPPEGMSQRFRLKIDQLEYYFQMSIASTPTGKEVRISRSW